MPPTMVPRGSSMARPVANADPTIMVSKWSMTCCRSAAPLVQQPGPTADNHQAEQGEISGQEVSDNLIEELLMRCRIDVGWRQIIGLPLLRLALLRDSAAALIKAEHRERGQQHGAGEPERRRCLE